MIRKLAVPLLFTVLVGAYAEEVVPGSLQDAQAQKFLKALRAIQVKCPESLSGVESDYLCATTSRDASTFRSVVDANTAHLKPVGPWASYTGEGDQQRSFLYKDGFMTVTYLPSNDIAGDDLVVVQYAIPHD